jgi:hypothetical protein
MARREFSPTALRAVLPAKLYAHRVHIPFVAFVVFVVQFPGHGPSNPKPVVTPTNPARG